MGLPHTPIIKKFFSNKIESSRPDWGDYLLEIADIFQCSMAKNWIGICWQIGFLP